jgi:hypothetical protein
MHFNHDFDDIVDGFCRPYRDSESQILKPNRIQIDGFELFRMYSDNFFQQRNGQFGLLHIRNDRTERAARALGPLFRRDFSIESLMDGKPNENGLSYQQKLIVTTSPCPLHGK